MKPKFIGIVIAIAMLLIIVPSSFAGKTQSKDVEFEQKDEVPALGYVYESNGKKVPVYLVPEDKDATQKALEAGIITKEEVEKARKVERELMRRRVPLCTQIGVQRGSGRDADDDYYKDYEHPEGEDYDYCITAWYWMVKGWPNSFLLPPHYGPNLFRRRMVIGLTDFPDWFADQQAYLRISQ